MAIATSEANHLDDTSLDEAPVLESGIPPPRRRSAETAYWDGDDHLELALVESTRVEANLGALVRGLNHLTAGARAARDANAALSREIDTVRALLARNRAEDTVLRHRVRLLEQTLAAERRDTSHERSTFIEQEDAFLSELLADHDREVRDLKQRLARALEREERTPAHSDSGAATIGSIKLKAVRIPLPTRLEGPEAPHPEELHNGPLLPPRPSSRPPLAQKPDPSTRPLVEYSLGSGEVAEEHVGSPRRRSHPPPSIGS